MESSSTAILLNQDTFYVGFLERLGKVYQHTVFDTYGSKAFGLLLVSIRPEVTVSMLHNEVLPFYRKHKIPVQRIMMEDRSKFFSTEYHHYEICLALKNGPTEQFFSS